MRLIEPTHPVHPLGPLMRRAMAEGNWTFRTLSERTRELDPRGRGVTHSYLSQVARGAESARRTETLELICQALGLDPAGVMEYRLAAARAQLDEREVGADQALENLRVLELALREHAAARPPQDGLSLEERLQAAGRAAQEIRESHPGRSREPGSDTGGDSAAGSSR